MFCYDPKKVFIGNGAKIQNLSLWPDLNEICCVGFYCDWKLLPNKKNRNFRLFGVISSISIFTKI